MRNTQFPDIERPIELGQAGAAASADAADIAAIPGLKDLWSQTLGDPSICVAILDGPADLSHPSLTHADLTQLDFGNNVLHASMSLSDHGTHVTSVIFGQHDGPVKGIAPRCRGLIIPIFRYARDGSLLPCKQEDVADAIQLALRHGANVINISGGQFSPGGQANVKLAEVVRTVGNHALIVSAAGNDGCDCLHVPGALPSVLAVGAMSADGQPLFFSNWGSLYRESGVLALGQDILGASVNGRFATYSGTSFATPIVSGVAALLLSLDRRTKPAQVREAILRSAIGCEAQWSPDCNRLLAGRLSISGSIQRLQRGEKNVNHASPSRPQVSAVAVPQAVEASTVGSSSVTDASSSRDALGDPQTQTTGRPDVAPLGCSCNCGGALPQYAYVIGKLSYDFVSDAREDSIDHALEPLAAVPHDPQVMNRLDFLRHIRGFKEIKVHTEIGGVKAITKDAATGLIKVTIRDDDPTFNVSGSDNDQWRAIAIAHLCVSYDGGANYVLSAVNASTDARVKIKVVNDRNFLLLNCPHNDFQYKFNEAKWYLPRRCEVTRVHNPFPHDASAATWTLNRGATVLYALSPAGSYSEESLQELSGFLLTHLGLTEKGLNFYYFTSCGENLRWDAAWDPCFNDNAVVEPSRREESEPDDLTTEKSERVAVPGAITGQVRLKNGVVVQAINPDMRGTAEWSRAELLKRIRREVYPGLTDEEEKRLSKKIAELIDRLDEDVRNSGLSPEERALNFASTQHVKLLEQVVPDLLGPFEVDSVLPPRKSLHCRQGSDCWDVEVSFFDPENITAAPIIVRQSVDVSDVVPVRVDEVKRFRRR